LTSYYFEKKQKEKDELLVGEEVVNGGKTELKDVEVEPESDH
jgi:hypothetical protein